MAIVITRKEVNGYYQDTGPERELTIRYNEVNATQKQVLLGIIT